MINIAYSFTEIVELMLSTLPPALVDSQNAARLRTMAAFLLPTLWGGFEFRLGKDQPDVDLWQIFMAEDRGPLLGYIGDHFSDAAPEEQARWTNMRKMLQYWCDHDTELKDIVHSMALEPRYMSPDAAVPEIPLGIWFSEKPVAVEKLHSTIVTMLHSIVGEGEIPALMQTLRHYMPNLETGVSLRAIGLFFKPEVGRAYIYLRNFNAESLIPYLQEVGWPGPYDEIQKLASWLSSYNEKLDVHFNIGPSLIPRMGIKVFPNGYGYSPHMNALLDDLVIRGLCDPEKRDALKKQPALLTPMKSRFNWPDHLIMESLTRPNPEQGSFYSFLSNIKLVYVPGKPLEAKAYIRFAHMWSRRHES
jgi:hypothetical protein